MYIKYVSISIISAVLLIYTFNTRGTQFNKNCPIVIEADQTSHYAKLTTNTSDYIAYKLFSWTTGNRFISLIRNNDRYYLSASEIDFKATPILTKEIDKNLGEKIFMNTLSVSKQMEMTTNALHPSCLIVGVKIAHKFKIQGVFMDQMGLFIGSRKPDSELEQIYFSLNRLYLNEFAVELEELEKLNRSNKDIEWVSDITELIGTKKQYKSYIKKLRINPFFQLSTKQNTFDGE